MTVQVLVQDRLDIEDLVTDADLRHYLANTDKVSCHNVLLHWKERIDDYANRLGIKDTLWDDTIFVFSIEMTWFVESLRRQGP